MNTKLSDATTSDVIRKFILQQFPLAREKSIGNDDSLLHDGLIDSMGTLDVVMFLEERYQLVLEDDDLVMENFATISTLTRLVESRLPC